MRARLLGCVAVLFLGSAFWGALRTSSRDVQSPLLIRLLQGPHTDAQFYSSPALALHASYSRADHFRTVETPRMTDFSPVGSGVADVRPTLQTDAVRSPKNQNWLYELLAWLPFGLLFLALLDRTSGPDEVARLVGEAGANVNSARSPQSGPRSSEPTTAFSA
jgi:hypothetical protein